MTTASFAEFDNVSKDYRVGVVKRRPVRVLSGVTFRVNPGQVYGIVGPNRAGKTTLVKLLLSLTRPSDGRVLRFGKPASRRQTLTRIGFTHEHQAFPQYLTAARVLDFYGILTGMSPSHVRSMAPKLLERVQLADRAAEPVSRYSKGMVARLGLAQALLNDPDLLVLDEPYEGLDLPGQQLVHEIIRDRRSQGKSVVLITHATADIEKLCDRVLLLKQGKPMFEGAVEDLLRDPSGARRTVEQALQRYFKYTL